MTDLIPDSNQSVFNSGIEHLRTLVTIERHIDQYLAEDDFINACKFLNLLRINLYEWFDSDEKIVEEQETLRQKANETANKIIDCQNQGREYIKAEEIENIYKWYLSLKKIIHKHGLRMPKRDDPNFALGGRSY